MPEGGDGGARHWDSVYAARPADQVSWYRAHLERSLAMIERAAPDRDAAIADVGGGESTLVDDLLERGYRNVIVLDISAVALAAARQRLGARSASVQWRVADITREELAAASFDVWHDRAVFHFLTEPEARADYVRQVARAVRPGGHVIVSAFGPEGPERCSGLAVQRYDASSLHGEFGASFRLVEHAVEVHTTPWGSPQQFVTCFCRVAGN